LPVVALMLSPQERALAETPAAAAYSYEAEVIENQAAHLWFTYKNLSGESHCVRTADLNFDFYSDSILVTNRNGKVMSYVGPTASGVRQRDLGEFTVIYPGGSAVRSLRLKNFYSVVALPVDVTYAFPVIPCAQLFGRKIEIPETWMLKERLSHGLSVEPSEFEARYREWADVGFVAVSKPLKIERRR